MSINIVVNDCQGELDNSKFFGEILLPEKWLEDDIFSPEEMFLCQINLEELNESVGRTMLPQSGTLFFFIDYNKKPKGVVRYFDGELDAYTLFNEGWEEGEDVETEYVITFNDEESDIKLLDGELNDKVVLLKYKNDGKLLEFMRDGKELYFLIDKQDLLSKDFSKIELLIK